MRPGTVLGRHSIFGQLSLASSNALKTILGQPAQGIAQGQGRQSDWGADFPVRRAEPLLPGNSNYAASTRPIRVPAGKSPPDEENAGTEGA